MKDAVLASTDQLVPKLCEALVPKLCEALVPVLVPKLCEALIPKLGTTPGDAVKGEAENKEFMWPQYNSNSKGSFIVGCPYNGGRNNNCQVIEHGCKDRKLKGAELSAHGENCSDHCKCHFFVKLTVTKKMMEDNKNLEEFKDVSDLTMAYRELGYTSHFGGAESSIWLEHSTNKNSKTTLMNHLKSFHKLTKQQIKEKFPILVAR